MAGRDERPDDPRLFLAVRRGAAVALVGAAVLLVIIDALSESFQVDSIVIGILLSGALLFAGVDGSGIWRR